MISIIVAVSENNVIGKDNDITWHFPGDMKYFKSKTQGHVVIMGRKTFESMGAKPLKNRENIVVTRQRDYSKQGIEVVNSLENALEKAKTYNDDETFIIGGGEIYRQALPFTDRVYLTRIHAEYEGDTYFPELLPNKWDLVSEERHEADGKHAHPFSFLVYERVNKN